jgi:hypothetical protein
MSERDVRILGETVLSDGRRFDFEHPVQEAWWWEDLLIVLFDPDAHSERFGQFPNLVAVDVNGTRRWVAELPTTTTGDRYYRIASREPLVAYALSSHDCEIDLRTGRIVRREFTK